MRVFVRPAIPCLFNLFLLIVSHKKNKQLSSEAGHPMHRDSDSLTGKEDSQGMIGPLVCQ